MHLPFGVSRKQPAATLLHLHIPKTGGTAVRRLLSQIFGEEHLHPERFAAFPFWPDTVNRSYRIVSGHLGIDMLGRFPAPVRMLTGLRDPLSRFISFYEFAAAMNNDSNVFSYMFNRHSLEALAGPEFETFTRHCGNAAVQHLSGLPSIMADQAGGSAKATAIATLPDIEFCYIFEAIEQELSRIVLELGYPPELNKIAHHNAGRSLALQSDIEPATLERLTALFSDDFELYELGYRDFLKRNPYGASHSLFSGANARRCRAGDADAFFMPPGQIGFLAHGPYMQLPRGTYRIRFTVIILEMPQVDPASEEFILTLDVSLRKAAIIAGQQRVTAGFLCRETGPVVVVAFDFTVASPASDVEYRAFLHRDCAIGIRCTVEVTRIF